MGIIILVAMAILLGGILAFIGTEDKYAKISNAGGCMIVLSIMAIIVLSIVLGRSYAGYLSLKRDQIAVYQYERAIDLYLVKAQIELESNAITDLKYNKYQDGLIRLIRDYRDCVNKYNNNLIARRTMNNSLMFNWLTVGPDPDMKEIYMKKY